GGGGEDGGVGGGGGRRRGGGGARGGGGDGAVDVRRARAGLGAARAVFAGVGLTVVRALEREEPAVRVAAELVADPARLEVHATVAEAIPVAGNHDLRDAGALAIRLRRHADVERHPAARPELGTRGRRARQCGRGGGAGGRAVARHAGG